MKTKQNHTPHAILLYRWLPPLLMMSIIFTLSSISSFHVTYQPWSDILLKKIAHMIEFGLLFLSWMHTLNAHAPHSSKNIIVAILLSILFAFSDEIHQSFVPGRHPSIVDVFIDTIGIYLAFRIKPYLISR